MEFLEIIQNCLEIFGIFIRFLDFSIRFMFEIFAKVYEIFSSDTPLGGVVLKNVGIFILLLRVPVGRDGVVNSPRFCVFFSFVNVESWATAHG